LVAFAVFFAFNLFLDNNVKAGTGYNEWFDFEQYNSSLMTFQDPEKIIDGNTLTYAQSSTGPEYLQFLDGNNATLLVNDKEISRVMVWSKWGCQNTAFDSYRLLPNFGNPNNDNGTWSEVTEIKDEHISANGGGWYYWNITNNQANHTEPWIQSEIKDLNMWLYASNRGSYVLCYEVRIKIFYLGYPELDTTTVVNDTKISLTWSRDENSNNTYIERNTVSDWARGAGTIVYNSTGTSYTDTGLTPGQIYYYRAWSYSNVNNIFSGNYTTSNVMITEPAPPTNAGFTAVNSSAVNITWTGGTGANTSILVRNTNAAPTSVTDGTIVYNGTNNYYVDTINTGDIYYYSVFSFANWTNPDASIFSSGYATLSTGGLTINVYDEDSLNGLTFDVFISNEDGSQVYNYTGATNPLFINETEVPTGSISIQINVSGYYDRFYYITLNSGAYYILNAYVPEAVTGTELKALNVAGPQTYFNTNPPIEDATVKINKYINETVGYESISIIKTDANGQCFLYLKNDESYKINITKNGYVTETSDITTADAIDSYTFRIYPNDYTSDEYFSFNEQVTFTVEMSGEYMQLGNITVTFIDSNNTMIDTDIYVYEVYNGITTLVNHSHNTSNSFSYKISGINTSRDHYAKLFYNSTVDFYDSSPLDIWIFLIHLFHGDREPFSFNDRVVDVIGPFVINDVNVGWHIILSLVVAFSFLILLGPYDTGLALIGCGLIIGLTQGIFSLWFTDTFPTALITLIPIFIIAGVVWYWAKGNGGDFI